MPILVLTSARRTPVDRILVLTSARRTPVDRILVLTSARRTPVDRRHVQYGSEVPFPRMVGRIIVLHGSEVGTFFSDGG